MLASLKGTDAVFVVKVARRADPDRVAAADAEYAALTQLQARGAGARWSQPIHAAFVDAERQYLVTVSVQVWWCALCADPPTRSITRAAAWRTCLLHNHLCHFLHSHSTHIAS